MKAFVIYTVLRLSLFVGCYVLIGGLWALFFDTKGLLLVPFLAAVIVSSLLSLKLLAPQRARFAAVVEARAQRASQRFEERKAREDTD
ncbi:MAG: DUF4229 domain-containing protein [Marmoricola sp.]